MAEMPKDTQPEGTLVVVVFQFGKVASTSIVNGLNAIEGVEAHQSHYLGHTAYERMLRNVMDPSIADYFFEHQLGQMAANIRISRRMARIESGTVPGRVAILTVVREHMDWFRSALVQDVVGHLDLLNGLYSIENPGQETGPRARVRAGINAMFDRILELIDECGGAEAFLSRFRNKDLSIFSERDFYALPGGPQFLFSFVRPLIWFPDHFLESTGIALSEFAAEDGFWKHDHGERAHYILRYEDLGTALPRVASELGLEGGVPLPEKNVSARKPFAEDVRDVCSGARAQQLKALFAGTDYQRFFGYTKRL